MPERRIFTTLLRSLGGFAARVAQRADADAIAAGLTVEVLPRGVHRYRDPRLDQLAAHRASHPSPTAPVAVGADWSQPRLIVSAGRSR
jgi:hypothetical protein